MKKFGKFIIILIILAGGYYFYVQKNKQAEAPILENGEMMKETNESDSAAIPTPSPSPSPQGRGMESAGGGTGTEGTFSSGEEGTMSPDVLVVQIDYDGSKYAPQTVNIKVGDIVIFKNNSEGLMWPASAPYPVHTDYPEFDPKAGVSFGGKWQFKFEKVGEWKFHDHLKPSVLGVINVSAR